MTWSVWERTEDGLQALFEACASEDLARQLAAAHTNPDALYVCPDYDEAATCSYCGAVNLSVSAPPVDDRGWTFAAVEHNVGCEWIETRAHSQDRVRCIRHEAFRATWRDVDAHALGGPIPLLAALDRHFGGTWGVTGFSNGRPFVFSCDQDSASLVKRLEEDGIVSIAVQSWQVPFILAGKVPLDISLIRMSTGDTFLSVSVPSYVNKAGWGVSSDPEFRNR